MTQILKLIILSTVSISQLRVSKIFIVWNVASCVLEVLIMKDLEQKGNSSLWGKLKSLTVVKCGPVAMQISRAKPQKCVKAWALSATEKVKEAVHWDQFALDFRSTLHRAVAVFGPLKCEWLWCILGGGDPQVLHPSLLVLAYLLLMLALDLWHLGSSLQPTLSTAMAFILSFNLGFLSIHH